MWGKIHLQSVCSLWGQRTRTTLLSLVRARLPTYRSQGSSFLDLLYTFVAVVHSYLQSRLIKHEWDASFFDVGASLKNCSRRLQRTKPCRSFSPKADKLLASLEQILPHSYYLWALLYILVLFMSLIVLFQLTFTFIYSTFSNEFSISAK